MTETSAPSSALTRSVTVLARAVVSGVQTASLYPPAHPQVAEAVTRLREAVGQFGDARGIVLGVTPETLLIDGHPLDDPDAYVSECAATLHERDIVRMTFSSDITRPSLAALLSVLALDVRTLRGRGGPAEAWRAAGDGAVLIEQIDYQQILADRDPGRPHAARDELWLHLVRSVGRRDAVWSEAAQARLLEVAGDPAAIGALAGDAIQATCTPDGSPLVTSQATTVLATFRHLQSIVAVMAPERAAEVTRNLAAATAELDPRVIGEMMRGGAADEDAAAVARALGSAFDERQVAQLLATTLALDGKATERLAEVFDTIVPDPERKGRVASLTKTLLQEGDFGTEGGFEALWSSVDSLIVSHDDRPFVSDEYRNALDAATTRGETMATVAPPPAELASWLETLEHDNVQALSVTLLSDLLRLETGSERATGLAADIQAMAEDLLLSGTYGEAVRLVEGLAERAAAPGAAGSGACRRALDELGDGAALRETVELFDHLDAAAFASIERCCKAIGPAAVEALLATLLFEHDTLARRRGADVIARFGAAVVSRLIPLAGHPQWFVRRNTAAVLGRIGTADAVPVLQPLLRGADPRVLREAVVALAGIDDPAAARAIHTVLRSATGDGRRAVIDALVEARDRRVVPVLGRILRESRPLGPDHQIVLETLAALATLRDDAGVPAITHVMRQWRWLTPRRNRTLKIAAVDTLRRIGTPAATAALRAASDHGDRLIRRIVRARSES